MHASGRLSRIWHLLSRISQGWLSTALRRPLQAGAVLPLLAGAACGGDTTGVPRLPHTEVGDAVMLSSLSDSVQLDVSVDAVEAEAMLVRIVEEARWLHDHAVVRVGGGDRPWIVANAPGAVRLEVRAVVDGSEAEPDTVDLRVEPRTAAIRSIEWGGALSFGDTITARGWRLSSLAADGLAPLVVDLVKGDSATTRFVVRGWSAWCDDGAPAGLGNVDLHPDVQIPDVPPLVSLAVGERVRLRSGNRCIRVPGGNPGYVLAWAEASYLRRTLEAGEEPDAVGEVYAVLHSGGGPNASVARPRDAAGQRSAQDGRHHRVVAEASDCQTQTGFSAAVLCAEEAYQAGDVLPGHRAETDSLEVLRVEGSVVYAAPRSVLGWIAGNGGDTWVQALADLYREHALPMLSATFDIPHPVSSHGSGQILVVLTDEGAGQAITVEGPDGPRTYVLVFAGREPAQSFRLLTHELTHGWYHAYTHRIQEDRPDVTRTLGGTWAREGVPEFAAQQALRRAAGLDVTANVTLDQLAYPPESLAFFYVAVAAPGFGSILGGYATAAGFFRDLLWRSMARGASFDESFAAITLGAIEGFFGPGGEAGTLGLTPRLRGLLGERWNPLDALLLWNLSMGMDERTDTPELQDPGFTDTEVLWAPHFEMAPGDGGRFALVGPADGSWALIHGGQGGRLTLATVVYEGGVNPRQLAVAEIEMEVARYR